MHDFYPQPTSYRRTSMAAEFARERAGRILRRAMLAGLVLYAFGATFKLIDARHELAKLEGCPR